MNRHRIAARARALRRDRSGNALLEFALGLPLLLVAGMWGVELTNLAIMNQRISQIALELADNASRVGLYTGQATVQLREADINDVMQAVRVHGQSIGLATNGRVILSSLENASGTQRIHWQRCLGMKSGADYDSHYGTTTTTAGTNTDTANAGTLAPDGMGDTGAKVNAPLGSGVMFVEVNYLYTPLVGNGWFASTRRIHYIASFIVRDTRDFAQIYNPTPTATRMTCNLYTT
ncbi:histidine kinase [Sphingomonas hengshuiensis]|uniref:Histidine kinase n=1 Tax=Sphingomonas hengshuiensis TaxID=1609977 RepID=A0A7U5BFI1_9SPHN|nr:histidine kinase [Sphingomonas hengshuiensis]